MLGVCMIDKIDIQRLLEICNSNLDQNLKAFENNEISEDTYFRTYDFYRGAKTYLELVLNDY